MIRRDTQMSSSSSSSDSLSTLPRATSILQRLAASSAGSSAAPAAESTTDLGPTGYSFQVGKEKLKMKRERKRKRRASLAGSSVAPAAESTTDLGPIGYSYQVRKENMKMKRERKRERRVAFWRKIFQAWKKIIPLGLGIDLVIVLLIVAKSISQNKFEILQELKTISNSFADAGRRGLQNEAIIDRKPDFCRPSGESCYWISKSKASWRMGEDICNKMGGFLAEIAGPRENSWLATRLMNQGKVWIGGGSSVGEDGRLDEGNVWRWSHSGIIFHKNFSDWSRFPDDAVTYRCLFFHVTGKHTHKWSYDRCRKWKRFICEISQSANATEDDGFVSSPVCVTLIQETTIKVTRTKKCFRFVQTRLRKKEAEKFCAERFSGELPEIETLKANETTIVAAAKRISPEATWRVLAQKMKHPSELKLKRGSVPWEGILYINNVAVKDDEFDLKDARVVCREFGLDVVDYVRDGRFGWILDRYQVINFLCRGDESRLLSCPHGTPIIMYDLGDVSGVICAPPSTEDAFKVTQSKIDAQKIDDSTPSWFLCQETDVVTTVGR